MALSRTGRGWLCHTEEVTDTRHWEPRPRGPLALIAAEIAAVSGERLVHPSTRTIGETAAVRRAYGHGVGVPADAARGATLEPTVETGASGGGWNAGARGGSRRIGEEIR